jgi:WD repeat-containing protein 55
VRAVRILPTKLLGVVVDHGDWPVERISIGGGMGQLSIEPEEDGITNSSRTHQNKSKISQGKTIETEQQQRWWVGSIGHDDTLRMTDLGGFFREVEQSEIRTLAPDVRDDDADTEEDEQFEEDSQPEEKPETRIAESNSPEQDKGESGEDSDIPQPKKRKRKAEKDTLNIMKKHKGKKSIAVDRSFFDGL